RVNRRRDTTARKRGRSSRSADGHARPVQGEWRGSWTTCFALLRGCDQQRVFNKASGESMQAEWSPLGIRQWREFHWRCPPVISRSPRMLAKDNRTFGKHDCTTCVIRQVALDEKLCFLRQVPLAGS